MKEPTKRKTISVDPQVMRDASKRMKSLKYRKFSHYVTALIEKDISEGGDHVIVRKAAVQDHEP